MAPVMKQFSCTVVFMPSSAWDLILIQWALVGDVLAALLDLFDFPQD